MKIRKQDYMLLLSFVLIFLGSATTKAATEAFPTLASLGASLFSDPSLSLNRNQSCSTCHNAGAGFIDPRDNGVAGAVSLGSNGISLGNRNAQTVSYARFSPGFTGADQNARGGQFWDGRAFDLRQQAEGPPVNPTEMAMPDRASVVARLEENSSYVEAFKSFFGDTVFNDTDTAYVAMTQAISTFEQSGTFAPFDSKYDRALAGTYTMTASESSGMNLFFSGRTNCSRCHRTPGVGARSPIDTFTDFRYRNIGTPTNATLNAVLVSLGQQVALTTTGEPGLLNNPAVGGNPATRGLLKVPTLRNVAVTAPYTHNGVFRNLQTVLHFYDHQGGNAARANNPETGAPWRAPENAATVNNGLLAMRNLSNDNINDLECFLRTLTDQKFEAIMPALRAGLNCS